MPLDFSFLNNEHMKINKNTFNFSSLAYSSLAIRNE